MTSSIVRLVGGHGCQDFDFNLGSVGKVRSVVNHVFNADRGHGSSEKVGFLKKPSEIVNSVVRTGLNSREMPSRLPQIGNCLPVIICSVVTMSRWLSTIGACFKIAKSLRGANHSIARKLNRYAGQTEYVLVAGD